MLIRKGLPYTYRDTKYKVDVKILDAKYPCYLYLRDTETYTYDVDIQIFDGNINKVTKYMSEKRHMATPNYKTPKYVNNDKFILPTHSYNVISSQPKRIAKYII